MEMLFGAQNPKIHSRPSLVRGLASFSSRRMKFKPNTSLYQPNHILFQRNFCNRVVPSNSIIIPQKEQNPQTLDLILSLLEHSLIALATTTSANRLPLPGPLQLDNLIFSLRSPRVSHSFRFESFSSASFAGGFRFGRISLDCPLAYSVTYLFPRLVPTFAR